MKKVLSILIVLITTVAGTNAQNNMNQREVNTLFSRDKTYGGFVGATTKFTQIDGLATLFTGGELCFVYNRVMNIGVAGYGAVTDILTYDIENPYNPYFLEMGYGGLFVEPVFFSHSLVHVTTPVIIGGGGMAQRTDRYWDYDFEDGDNWQTGTYRSDFFLLIEPGVNAELNLTRWCRVTAGLSYRMVSDAQIPGLDRASVDGLSGNISLRLGWF